MNGTEKHRKQGRRLLSRRTSVAVILLLIAVGIPVYAEDIPAGVDAVVELTNIGVEGWRVVDVRGEGAVDAGAGMARIALESGRRYHFDLSAVDSELFAMEFRGRSGRVIFSQVETDADSPDSEIGTEADEELDLEIDEEGITFTLSDTLAQRLSSFRAVRFPAMTGIVTVVPAGLPGDEIVDPDVEEPDTVDPESD